LAFAVVLGTLACAAGCGSTNTPGGEAPADGGGDSGPSQLVDAGDAGARDAGPSRDSGAGDAGATSPDASADSGPPPPLALPTSIGSSSAASYGTTERYRLYLSAGAPQPYGDGRSSNYSLRLGVRPPE
jgi:hypothetical protein